MFVILTCKNRLVTLLPLCCAVMIKGVHVDYLREYHTIEVQDKALGVKVDTA